MHVTSAGEVLVGGEPELGGHLLIARLGHQLRRHRQRRHTDSDHARIHDGRGPGELIPRRADIVRQRTKVTVGTCPGLHLLLLKLRPEPANPSPAQAPGAPRLAFTHLVQDQTSHRDGTPADRSTRSNSS